jgi:hypothetical protein
LLTVYANQLVAHALQHWYLRYPLTLYVPHLPIVNYVLSFLC